MSEPMELNRDDLKVKSFYELDDFLDTEEKNNITLVESILNVDEKNKEEVLKIIENSGKDISFILKCIEYIMKIRPNKTKDLFALFSQLARKNNYNGYETFDILHKLLIKEGIVPNYSEVEDNETVEDIIGIFPEGSIERAIRDDDIDLFIKLTANEDFDPEDEIEIDENTVLGNINKGFLISYMKLIVFFGSIRCFKAVLLNGYIIKEEINKYAIAGGNNEIIHILKQNNISYDDCYETSVKYHRYNISDWLLNECKCNSICQMTCMECYNYRALYFFVKNEINVSPQDFDDDFIFAALEGKLENVRYIVEVCNKEINEIELKAAWVAAVKYGYLPIVEYLFEKYKLDTEKRIDNGRTIMYFAVWYRHLQIVRYLIEKCHCNKYVRDKYDNTPLHFAAYVGNLPIVRYLVEVCKCDINKKNANGETPLQFAQPKIQLFGTNEAIIYLQNIESK